MPDQDKNLLSIGEAAKYLGVHIDTLRRWDKAGKIKASKSRGGVRRFNTNDLAKIKAGEALPANGLLSIGSAAEYLHVSIATLRRWDAAGKLEPVRTEGGMRQYRIEDLQEIQNTQKTQIAQSTQIIGEPESQTSQIGQVAGPPRLWRVEANPWRTFSSGLGIGSGAAAVFVASVLVGVLATGVIFPWIAGLASQGDALRAQKASPYQDTYQDILAETASAKYLEFNIDTKFNEDFYLNNHQLKLLGDASLDQNLTKTSSPTFSSLTLSASSKQIKTGSYELTLPSASTTLVGTDVSQTLTNKTMSGSSNTFSSIPNSALSNSKVTVTAGTNLSGGGDVSLGSSVTLNMASNINVSSVSATSLHVAGDATVAGQLKLGNFTGNPAGAIGAGTLYYNTTAQAVYAYNGSAWGQVGINYWDLANGVIYPGNTTLGFLIGGSATASAKFSVESTTGNATTSGTLGVGSNTTIRGDLNVGGNTVLSGNLTAGTTTANTLVVNGYVGSNLIPQTGSLYDLGSNTRKWANIYADNITGSITGTIAVGGTTYSDWAINNDNATADTEDATLTFERGSPAVNTEIRWDSSPNYFLSTNAPTFFINPDSGINYSGKAALIVKQIQNQDILAASNSAGTKFVISNGGNVLPGTTNSQDIGSSDLIWNTGYYNNVYISGNVYSTTGGGAIGYWQRANGAIAPVNITDDILVGGTATASAKFQVFGLSALNPVASISASSAKAALVIDNTVGDLFTASSSGLTRFVISQSGQVAVYRDMVVGGSTSLTETLANTGFSLGGDDLFVAGMAGIEGSIYTDGSFIAGASTTLSNGSLTQSASEQFSLLQGSNTYLDISTTGNLSLGYASGTTAITSSDWAISTSGDMTGIGAITADGTIAFSGALNANAGLDVDDTFTIGDATGFLSNAGITGLNNIPGALSLNDVTAIVATSSAYPTLTVRGLSTMPAASISGTSAMATLVVDNTVGDLFTASSSGLSRFVITQAGNVGIGTTSPVSLLSISGAGSAPSTNPALGGLFGWTNGVTQVVQTIDSNTPFTASIQHKQVGATATYPIALNPLGGSVGVGTTNPSGLVQFVANQNAGTSFSITNNSSGTGAFAAIAAAQAYGSGSTNLYTFGASYTTAGRYIQDSGVLEADSSLSGGLGIATGANAPIMFWTNGDNERMRITGAGNVGIGTTEPTSKLHVDGQCVALGTLIKRRKKKEKRRKNGEWDDEWEDIPVEDIKVDDEVLTLDEKTGEFVWQKVEKTIDKGTQTVFEITTSGQKRLKVTDQHPFFIIDKPQITQATFEVDLSIRFDHFTQPTFVGIAQSGGNLKYAVKIDQTDKKQLREFYQKRNKPELFQSHLYAHAISEAFKSWGVYPSRIIVDKEYPGHESPIRDIIKSTFPETDVLFSLVGKGPAHDVAYNALNRRTPVNARLGVSFEAIKSGQGSIKILRVLPPRTDYRGSGHPHGQLMQLSYYKEAGLSRGKWVKQKNLQKGTYLATQDGWEKITGIRKIGRKHTFDLQIANTHNFVANGIVAHNTTGKSLVNLNYTGTDQNIFTASQAGVLKFALNGIGTLPVASISATTSFAGLVVDNSGVGDLFTASSSGLSRFVITQAGNVGIGTTGPATKLDVNGNFLTSGGTVWLGTAAQTTGAPIIYSTGSGSGGGAIQLYQISHATLANAVQLQNAGTVALTAVSGNVGIGTTGPTSKLHVDGLTAGKSLVTFNNTGTDQNIFSASQSGVLKFALNGIGTLPVASISATTSFAGLVVDNTVGDLFTASSSGLPRLVVTQAGNVGIGTAVPTVALDVTGAGLFSGALTASGLLNANGGLDVDDTFTIEDATGFLSNAGITGLNNIPGALSFNDVTAIVATSSAYPTLTVRGLSTMPAASISGTSAMATLVVDNTVGDLFTASSSGLTRFVIAQSGYVGIGAAAPSAILEIDSSLTGVNLFDVQSANSSVFTVSDVGITSALPHSFTAAGDVSIAYDLHFSNMTASRILSDAPLSLESGELFNSSDLTLRTYNSGNVVIDSQALFAQYAATVAGQLLVGTSSATPNIGNFYLTNDIVRGKALAILNQTESADIFAASASATTRFMLSNAGRLGLNTANPLATADLRSISGIQPVASISGATSFASLVVDNSGVGDIFTASSSGLNRFVITQAGNVGIGVTTSGYKLRIDGAPDNEGVIVRVQDTSATGSNTTFGGIMFGSSPGTDYVWGKKSVSSTTYAQLRTGAGAELITVDSTGNVGIGTTGPLNRLDVRGANATTATATVSASSNFAALVIDNTIGPVFTASTSGVTQFEIQQDGDVRINNLSTNGAVYSNAGVLTNTNPSSALYKSNIAETNLDSERLLGLSVKSFTWNSTGQEDYGFIAEDIKDLVPELYLEQNGIKGYRHDHLTFYLFDLVKELKLEEIPAIKSDIAALKEEMASVSARLAKAEESIVTASSSATLVSDLSDLSNLNILSDLDIATISGDLTVTGLTQLARTSIGGSLTVGLLAFDDLKADISSLGDTLSFQNGALTLSFGKGLTLGQGQTLISANGNLEVKGKILGNDSMRGELIIKSGQTFTRFNAGVGEWETAPKSVVVTPTWKVLTWIEDLTAGGFTVKVDAATNVDRRVFWQAMW